MKLYRSKMYVPGNRASWMEKAAGYGADCLILDLEDSVPDPEKLAARSLVQAAVVALKARGQAVNVRVNPFVTGLTLDDLEAIICPELNGILLSKVETAADMMQLDALITHIEKRKGIAPGTIETPLACETAKGMRNLYDIATACPRVKRVGLAAGPGGDAARAIGYQWSKEGTETLFLRSRAVLESRAAGIEFPTVSSWWNIKDLEGLERDARLNRQLGFRGMTVMHPTHVPIVNRVFTPSQEEVAFYEGLIQAMDEARKRGVAAVTYQGDMVDEAMVKTAHDVLALARSL
jgi:citrate lyase subunit beta/citryl-CoA lyase